MSMNSGYKGTALSSTRKATDHDGTVCFKTLGHEVSNTEVALASLPPLPPSVIGAHYEREHEHQRRSPRRLTLRKDDRAFEIDDWGTTDTEDTGRAYSMSVVSTRRVQQEDHV
jgi:hypothetical protein